MQNNFSNNSKESFLAEFNSLDTITKRFEFWNDKLGQPYISFLFLTSPYYYYSRTFDESETAFRMEDFIILPTQDEFSDYNNLVFNQFRKYFDQRSVKIPLFDLEGMKNKYLEDLENAINKEI